MRILVVNAGSSSIKLRVLDDANEVQAGADVEAPDGIEPTAIRDALGRFGGEIDAVGHRIVHGGSEFSGPVLIDDDVVDRLAALTDLAPLHQPRSLAALTAVTALLPDVPAVACFDTAFHATLPTEASTYALPSAWRRRWDLRRFGFHGLSHAYASRRGAELLGRPLEGLRVVTCHLGAGASLAAVRDGRSVDTTMGFTPLEGLVMATRSGSVDPGLVLWLEEHIGIAPAEVAATLENRSGLLGLTGTSDMREVLTREAAGDELASLGVAVYLHRLRGLIAAMAAAMGGMDALVFTGGVGENSPDVRARTIDGLGFLGLRLDPDANDRGSGDRSISLVDAPARALVVQAREDLEIARQVRETLRAA